MSEQSYSTVLGPEDLTPGTYVTIRDAVSSEDDDAGFGDNPFELAGAPASMGSGIMAIKQEEEPIEERLSGQPLLIVANSYPFVACLHTPDGTRVVLDARNVNMIRVNEGFVGFLVDERYYRKRFPFLFRNGEPCEPDDLPETAALAVQGRGVKTMNNVENMIGASGDGPSNHPDMPSADDVRSLLEGDDG